MKRDSDPFTVFLTLALVAFLVWVGARWLQEHNGQIPNRDKVITTIE